jgi:hypothetical protein
MLATMPIFPRLTCASLENLEPRFESSGFEPLDSEMQHLKGTVPRRLQISHANTRYHDYLERSTYIRIHALFTLCEIAMSREYMPFLPWHGKTVRGPLDDRAALGLIPDVNRQPLQDRAWFKAAKAFLTVFEHYQDHNSLAPLANNPVVGFTMYSVACGKWGPAILFPTLHETNGCVALYCNHLRGADTPELQPMLEGASQFVESLCTQWKIATPWLQSLAFCVPAAMNLMREGIMLTLASLRKQTFNPPDNGNLIWLKKENAPSPDELSLSIGHETRKPYDPVRDR